MGEAPEAYIPLRKNDLVEELCASGELSSGEEQGFRSLCRLIGAVYHVEFLRLLDNLKNAYAPFDPDADTRILAFEPSARKLHKLNDLFGEFSSLMARADFRHLSGDDIELALHARSHWGLDMDVDFSVFERLAIFARGETREKRQRRRRWRPWVVEEIDVPIYQRLVMILKLRKHERIGKDVDTDKIYLQVFKNIPRLDIRMLLPGARVRINQVDRGKIGFSLLGGILLTIGRMAGLAFNNLLQFAWLRNVPEILLLNHPFAIWGLAGGAFGYGWRSYYNYQQTKQRYNLSLTQILYFQNLDTNAGVLFRLIDEAEEQECRETILAYYVLWKRGGCVGCTGADLDAAVRQEIERAAGITVAFELRDTLAVLLRLNLVEQVNGCYRARPLPVAIETLEWTWARFCKYNSLPASPSRPTLPAGPAGAP